MAADAIALSFDRYGISSFWMATMTASSMSSTLGELFMTGLRGSRGVG